MCASCGCGLVNEDHGDERHITLDDLQEAADAAGTDIDQVLTNLQESVKLGERELSERQA
ncbi:MAG: hypothetical protein WEE64_03230 [Dehalococcoidia bacterium]